MRDAQQCPEICGWYPVSIAHLEYADRELTPLEQLVGERSPDAEALGGDVHRHGRARVCE